MNLLSRWRRKAAEDEESVYVSERHGVRSLHIGSDTIQSSMRIARPNDLELSYTRSMMSFLLFVPAPRRVLMIGLGGGSLAKFVYHRLPEARVDAIEVNPRVVAIARRSFNVPPDDERLQVIVGDGAEHVRREDVRADAILVDGYEADRHVEEVATAAFYAACRERLTPGGVMAVNLWGGDKLFYTLSRRIEDAFPGGTLCLPAERPGNVVVFGFERKPGPLAWSALEARARELESLHALEFSRFVQSLKKMNPHDAQSLYP
ncbi:MAG TPA: polyamine aminopropyltransferase [Burkholderiales bacterium]|nr:polyamine aminopropyltransferase [Burkholderiales bacterium]